METTNKPWVILADPNNSDYIQEYIKVKGFRFGQASFRFGDFFSEDGKSLGNDYRYVENAGYRIIQTSELNQIIKDMNKTNQSDPFTLPKNWHVVVTKENQKEVSEWYGIQLNYGSITGMVENTRGIEKSWNYGHLNKKTNKYDFGTEITTEQFRKYVLKKEEIIIPPYPKVMEVSQIESFPQPLKRVVFMQKCDCYLAWESAETIEESEKETKVVKWNYARDIREFIYLTPQDISEGKGVGIDPKLIKFKE